MSMFVRRCFVILSGLALVGTSAACKKNSTLPTPVQSTDQISGTVQKSGESVKTFDVNYSLSATPASVTVTGLTLASTGAALNTTIGVAFGTFNTFDSTCTRAAAATNAAAIIGTEYETQALFVQGKFCISVFDGGTLTEATNYTLTIKHY